MDSRDVFRTEFWQAPYLSPIWQHINSFQTRPSFQTCPMIMPDPVPSHVSFWANPTFLFPEFRRMLNRLVVFNKRRYTDVDKFMFAEQIYNLDRCMTVIEDLVDVDGG